MLYTRPGDDEWVVIFNRSITQWGHIANYDYKVRKQEVGQITLTRQRPAGHVEQMTFRREVGADNSVILILEWEQSLIRIPVAPASGRGRE